MQQLFLDWSPFFQYIYGQKAWKMWLFVYYIIIYKFIYTFVFTTWKLDLQTATLCFLGYWKNQRKHFHLWCISFDHFWFLSLFHLRLASGDISISAFLFCSSVLVWTLNTDKTSGEGLHTDLSRCELTTKSTHDLNCATPKHLNVHHTIIASTWRRYYILAWDYFNKITT